MKRYIFMAEGSSMDPVIAEGLLGKLRSFADLEPNWDSYNADAIADVSIEKGMDILNYIFSNIALPQNLLIDIFPMRDGGVQIDLDSVKSAEIEINPKGDMQCMVFEGGVKLKEVPFFIEGLPELIKILSV